jgi:uncharacterized protein (TIGR03546 family)
MFWLKPFRFVAKALTSEVTPKRMALGCALGLWVGLVPKGNLTAIALMMVLGTLRVNLGAGLFAAFTFSWIGSFIDPFTHRIGSLLLSAEWLRPVWTSMYDTPLVPWTGFNNSVVLGSFLLGMLLLYPCYRLTEPLFARYTPDLTERLARFRIVQLIWGADFASKLR